MFESIHINTVCLLIIEGIHSIYLSVCLSSLPYCNINLILTSFSVTHHIFSTLIYVRSVKHKGHELKWKKQGTVT